MDRKADALRLIAWNRSQNYDDATVRKIQRVVGTTPDGIIGPKTVIAVIKWQSDHGLLVDGKVGPNTLAKIQEVSNAQTTPSSLGKRCPPQGNVATLGLWWDLGPDWSVDAGDRFADQLAEWGVDVVALMGDRSVSTKDLVKAGIGNVAPRWRWTPDDAGRFAKALHARGIQVDIVTWPRPTVRYLTEHHVVLQHLVEAVDARCVQLDLEGNWRTRDYRRKHTLIDGFDDLHEAAEHLMDSVRYCTVPIAVTTYFWHGEHSADSATVSPHADKIIIQAYATHKDGPDSEDWGANMGPGEQQHAAARRVEDVLAPQAKLAMGLPAYRQNYPGHGTEKAMRVQLEAALQYTDEVHYWSAKHVVEGSRHRNKRAQAFFAQIKQRYGA